MRAKPAVAAVLGLALAALYLPVPSGADVPSTAPGRLSAADGHVTWGGSFTDQAGASSPEAYRQPGACQGLPCHETTLEVALPPDVWEDGGAGGVQVAVDWFPDEENDLDLYVYGPDGTLAARSDGVVASTGESVRIAGAANGRYRLVVVPRLVAGELHYRGFAEVERPPAATPVRPLLPNLVTLPPRNPHVRTGAYFADPGAEGTPSCYPEEVAERGARRCLRFDQIIANHGEGPFELRYRMEGVATERQLTQRLMASDGSFNDTKVDTYEFHPTHAHFHYKNFGQAFLYKERPDGSLELVRKGRKNGFCMIDVENTRFGLGPDGQPFRGEAPRTYYFPRCNAPTERDESGTSMVNGISPGWADVYNWFLADQFIEITGVPDGDYVIETVANPAGTVVETTLADNRAVARVRLTGDQVELLP